MSYSVGSLRITYVVYSIGTAFFLATILGAIAAWLDPNQLDTTDKTWSSVLFLMTFLFSLFYMLCVQGNICCSSEMIVFPPDTNDSIDNEVHVKEKENLFDINLVEVSLLKGK